MLTKNSSISELGDLTSTVAKALIERFGSPLFVLDRTKLASQYDNISSAFRFLYPKTRIAYSFKTNYMPFICKALYNLGSYAEIIPGFEIDLAIRLGIAGNRIILNGPYKPRNELLRLLNYDARCRINVDNLEELNLINEIAKEKHKVLGIGIRVDTNSGSSPRSKFGFGVKNDEAFNMAKYVCNDLKHLRLVGLHTHIGSNIPDASLYRRTSTKLVNLVSRIDGKLGMKLEYLDFGGGFAPEGGEVPIGLEHTWRVASAVEYAKAICKPLNDFYGNSERPELILELGRYLVGNAMSLLATVTAIKDIDGKRSIFLDAGINILPSAVRRRHHIDAYTNNKRISPANIYGPLCTQRDLLVTDAMLPQVNVGDLVRISSAGAYELSESMQFIRPRPAAVCMGDKGARLLKRKENLDDIMNTDVWAEVDGSAQKFFRRRIPK